MQTETLARYQSQQIGAKLDAINTRELSLFQKSRAGARRLFRGAARSNGLCAPARINYTRAAIAPLSSSRFGLLFISARRAEIDFVPYAQDLLNSHYSSAMILSINFNGKPNINQSANDQSSVLPLSILLPLVALNYVNFSFKRN